MSARACRCVQVRARVCVVARWRDVEYLHSAPACIASLHIARGSQLMSRNDARVHRRRHGLPSSNSKARTAAWGRRYTCPPKDSRRQTFAGSRRRCFRRSGGSPQSCLSRCTCRCTMEEPVRNSGKSAAAQDISESPHLQYCWHPASRPSGTAPILQFWQKVPATLKPLQTF